jgi:hypothetical protein
MLSVLLLLAVTPSLSANSSIVTTMSSPTMAAVNACVMAIECTTTGAGDYTGCQPEGIGDYKELFIANSLAILVIGSIGNLITLIAILYVRFK